MLLARGLLRAGATGPGPADSVTLARATLVGAVTALVADSFTRATPTVLLVCLSAAALVLDAVDGWVARRTGTTSPLGARFDMEVDAFLILVLSVAVARSVGPWVLAIGWARYAFVAAGWLLPWLTTPTPPRYWCKVVAAIQGIVLTVAVVGVLPPARDRAGAGGRVGAAHRVVRSGRVVAVQAAPPRAAPAGGAPNAGRGGVTVTDQEVVDRPAEESPPTDPQRPSRLRAAASRVVTVLAVLMVWLSLALPNRVTGLSPWLFLRLPVEALVIAAVCLVLPHRLRQVLAAVAGLAIAVVALLKLLDIGFYDALDRPFNPVTDSSYFGPAFGVLRDSVGSGRADVVAVVGLLLLAALLLAFPLAVLRLTRLSLRNRRRSVRALLALSVDLGAARRARPAGRGRRDGRVRQHRQPGVRTKLTGYAPASRTRRPSQQPLGRPTATPSPPAPTC